MARKTPPSFDFFPDDWVGGTIHMDAIEVGMYVRSICFQWGNGSLPNDTKRLQRITGVFGDEFDAHWPIVAEKFADDGNGGLVNNRLESERSKKLMISEKRAKAGRKGGQANASDLLKQNGKQKQSKGKREVGSRKMEVGSTENGSRKSETGYTPEFETFWQKCPRKTGKGQAFEAFKKAVAEIGSDDAWKRITAAMVKFSRLEWPEDRPIEDLPYCPHPATWLNQRRWEDEPTQWKPRTNGKHEQPQPPSYRDLAELD